VIGFAVDMLVVVCVGVGIRCGVVLDVSVVDCVDGECNVVACSIGGIGGGDDIDVVVCVTGV